MSKNKSKPHSVVRSFFIRAILWLIPSLALWYWGRMYFATAPAWVAHEVMTTLFPFWVTGTELHGTTLALLTNLGVRGETGQIIGDLAPEADVLTYAYGTPFLIALFLAVRSKQLWWKIPLGVLILLPFQAWGVCFALLSQVAVKATPDTYAQTRFDAFDMNLIAAGYQIGFLLLPALAPIIIWLAMDHRLIHHVLVEGAITAADDD